MICLKRGFFLLIFIFCAACSYGQVWKQYTDSAKTYQEQQRTDKAIEFYIKAREALKKDSIDTKSYFFSCSALANLYTLTRQYIQAELLYLEAKAVIEKLSGREHPNYAFACYNLSNLYLYMGKLEKAEPLSLEAKELREKVLGKEHIDYASSCNTMANIYTSKGHYEKAEFLYLEAKNIWEKVLGKEHANYAISCNNLANLYKSMGKYEKAAPLCIEAKEIWEKTAGKKDLNYALSCVNLANLYKEMGQYEQAEPLCLEAKEIREEILGKEHPDYAQSCNSLANLYKNMGQYKKAEPLYQEAKRIREKVLGKHHAAYGSSCNTLANLYSDMGLYEKAELLYVEAKQIWGKVLGREHPDYATCCNNLANLYERMRLYKKAEPLYLEAKKIQKKVLGGTHPDYARTCDNLATFYMDIHQYKKAELLYVDAKQIREMQLGKNHPEYALSCNNLADLYYDMNQYKKAESLYLEAKSIQEKVLGKKHLDYGISCGNMANLYRLLHHPVEAEKEFEESLAVNAYNLSSVFQFTNEKEKAAFINNIVGEDDDAYSFFVSDKIKSGHPYTLSLFHRNLILSSSEVLKKQIFSSNDTTLINTYNEWLSFKKQLSVLYAKPVDERKGDVTTIEEKAEQLEKQLTRLSSPFAKQQQRLKWKDIQNKLHADEASIEFASFRLTNGKRHTDTIIYAAFVLRKDSLLPTTTILFAEKQLQDLLTSTEYKTTKAGVQRLYASDGITVNNKSSKISIYDLVWKPLEKELKGIKTIYFAPSGLLHRIAFSALPVSSKIVLSDRYKLIQLATTVTVADQQNSYITDADKLQLYGGISYNADTTALKDAAVVYHHDKAANRSLPDDVTRSGQWNELPGTNKEIESIVALSGTYKTNITSHSGINATEENMKSLDGKASPAVLHIATHGFFFADPKQEKKDKINFESGTAFKLSDDPLIRSGLLFAGANNAWQNKPVEGIDDGILTAYEVSNLYLPNTKLVVLSACETGLGDIKRNEGVYGLQRAFKMAGVGNLVMSLWKVSDLETAEFMEAFYKNMFAQQTISDAFYNAQNIMKNKYRQQPFKWAAWVLVR